MDVKKFVDYKKKNQLHVSPGTEKESICVVLSLYNRDSGELEVAETGTIKKADLLAQKANLQAQISALDSILDEFPAGG